MKAKHVKDSTSEQVHLLMHSHMNGSDRLFGGQLLAWIDVVAAVVARRHSERNVITAAIDNLQFKSGVYLNNTVVLIGKLTYVGRTSMEVRVDTYVEDLDGMRRVINRAYLVLVAIDDDGKPVAVPPLIVESESEKAEWAAGSRRHDLRIQRRKEGF